MQSKISTTQLELFNDSPLDETSLFHDPGRPGFFSIFVRPAMADPRQRSYRLDLLPQVLASLDRHNDTYISQAEFFKPNRRLVNLWRLGLAFVDLDTYQTKWGSRTPEEVSLSVRTFLHDEGIPAASLIVSSGRGLYLKWLFETPIPQSALPRWNAVQRELVERLQGFGADPMAKDASRVLRLVQTVHAKTGDVVRVLHVEEAEGEPKRYGFDRLAGAVLPVERPQSQKDVSRRPFKVVEGGLGRERSLAWARLTDLRLLQDIRGRVVPEGEREVSLFWRLNFLLQSGQATARNAYHEARALARELDPGFVMGRDWQESDLSTLYHRAQQGHRSLYRVRNDTLLNRFRITPDEERRMSTIISATEKYRRLCAKRAPGIAARREAKAELHNQIRVAVRSGALSQAEAARTFGLSRMHVYRILRV